MNKVSFEIAAAELTRLYTAAEPAHARHLSRELFELLRKTHELAFVFQGLPREMATAAADAKLSELPRT